MKRIRFDTWQPLAWYGVSLRIPDEWNPGQIAGDAHSGNVRLDDAQIVRVELEWKDAGGDTVVSTVVDRYVESLAKNAQKQKRSLNVERGIELPGLEVAHLQSVECFRWRAGTDVHTLVGYSETSDRLIFVRVMSRPDEDATELLVRLFNSLRDTAPDAPQPWALYGLAVQVPPNYRLEEYDLKSGHIRLHFEKDKSQLRVDRLSLAQVLLSGISLTQWYERFFAKDLRFIDVTLKEEGDGLQIEGTPKGRLNSLLQPLPFWNSRPRLHLRGRAWVSEEENKIFAVQSFFKKEEDAPDLAQICQTVNPSEAASVGV